MRGVSGFFLATILLGAAAAKAQNFAEGISGDVDSKRRGPVVSVGTEHAANPKRVKLLVDAYMVNEEFAKYPIRFDFFVNRHLLSSQIRSVELPGPVGVEVGEEIAPLPFNYTVVATLLHPNRQFTSVYYGAAFASNLTAKLDCTLTVVSIAVEGQDESEQAFTSADVSLSQSSNDTVALTFEGKNDASGDTVGVEGTFTIDVANKTEISSGSLSVTRNGTPTTYAVTGEVTYEEENVTALSVENADSGVTLRCE